MASGQGSSCLIESTVIVHLCVILPSEIFGVFKNIFTLLAFTQYVDNVFYSFIVLCENEYFLMSNLH